MPRRHLLAIAIAALSAIGCDSYAATTLVTSCDDEGNGSLRAAIAQASDHDLIDLTKLTCSTITLSTGAINVSPAHLSIVGPGAGKLTFRGEPASLQHDRLFKQYGTIYGGRVDNGDLRISGVTLADGYVSDYLSTEVEGGCIKAFDGLELTNTIVSNCSLVVPVSSNPYASPVSFVRGGCLAATRTTLTSSVVSGCSANGIGQHSGGSGGGVYSGTLAMNFSTISQSKALSANNELTLGGCVETSSLKMRFSSLIGCEADRGGGARVYGGSINIYSSTIANNKATDDAGGLYAIPFPDPAILVNSTISDNVSLGIAAGIYLYGGIQASQRTIARNIAYRFRTNSASGITVSQYVTAPLQFDNMLIANNSSNALERDIGVGPQAAVTGAGNLFQTAFGSVPSSVYIEGCPWLGPLRNNGGPTLTSALMSGSIGLDAGANVDPTLFDQRGLGYRRIAPGHDRPDIGAIEQQVENIFSSNFDGCVFVF